MRIGQILSAAAVFFTCGLLGAKEYDNILLYKNCGTWENNASVIREGVDAGRIAWDGKALRFTPRGGSFDLKNIYCFGFGMQVPENMRNRPFTVKFIYESGNPVVWNVRTPSHIGWRGVNTKILADRWPYIRPEKLKAVEFEAGTADFQAVLDDLRFVPKGLDFQFEDAWVPPVTGGCFFPEYTLEQQRTETLNDPKFKEKMAEIERLRKAKLKISLKPQHTDPKELTGSADLARIRPDGSIEGLDYEDAVRLNKQRRDWHDVNETYMSQHCAFFGKLLSSWESGRVPRTEENRRKLIKSLIRTMTAETNRREECYHYIIPAFLFPSLACRVYRVFCDEMEAVEKGTNRDPDLILLNRLLKETASWCYFHTFYNTVGPALTVDSFRGDSNWTGGNFGYRPTFWAALICRNPKMLDVISNVAKGALGLVSWNTMKEAFWIDGLTADGSAWGHRNQNYPFGYPLDGFEALAGLIGNLSGTSWALNTDGPAMNAFCNYMEGLLWHATGWAKNDIRYIRTEQLLQRDIPAACGRRGQIYREGKGYDTFGKAFWTANAFGRLLPEGSEGRKRLQYCADVMSGKIRKLPEGTRYFWNNDLLICREKDSLVPVSMLSGRVLSVESAPSASHFTDFWGDGAAWNGTDNVSDTTKDFDPRDFGAKGDGIVKDTVAIQRAIDECSRSGGGRVVLSRGKFLSGMVSFKDGVDLHIDVGAVLLGSPDDADFPTNVTCTVLDPDKTARGRTTALVIADGCRNVALTGRGQIDCNGMAYVRLSNKRGLGYVNEGNAGDAKPLGDDEWVNWRYRRIPGKLGPPRMVLFAGCQDVLVEDVSVVNSAAGWGYWVTGCDRVVFERAKVLANPDLPNNDGIHINASRDVSVSNCRIVAGDDAIVVRCNNRPFRDGRNRVCERVTVSNCQLTSHANAIRIGWLNDGVVRNCVFSNLSVTDSACGIGIDLPPLAKGMTDYGCEASLYENLVFSSIVMDRIYSSPVRIDITGEEFTRMEAIRAITFSDIRARAYKFPDLRVAPGRELADIVFRGCSFTRCIDGAFPGNWRQKGAAYWWNEGREKFRGIAGVSFEGCSFADEAAK